MEEIADTVRLAVERRPEITAAYLFGSAAAGHMRWDSDVDVAVLVEESVPKERTFDLEAELAAELEPKLRRRLDLVVLNRAPLLLRYMVYRANRPVFERDPGRAHIFQAQSLSRWYDFAPAHREACRVAIARMTERTRHGPA